MASPDPIATMSSTANDPANRGDGPNPLPVGICVKVANSCGDANVAGRVGIVRSGATRGLVAVEFSPIDKRVLKSEHVLPVAPNKNDRVHTYFHIYSNRLAVSCRC